MRLVHYTTYPSFRAASAPAFSRSPWAGLEQEIDRLFATTAGELGAGFAGRGFPVDVYEDKGATYVRAELPGVNRNEIQVEIVDGQLVLAASRKSSAGTGQAESTESFSRTLTLSDDVQADKISAAYEHGVLTVTLPKSEAALPKKITVAVK